MKLNKKQKEEERKKMYQLKEVDEYKPEPINWKRKIIVISIILAIITGVVLIWLFVIKGKDYLEYKSTAKDFYHVAAVEADETKVANFDYENDQLKQSAIQAAHEIYAVYHSQGGFDYTPDTGTKIENYKYTGRSFNHLLISKTDYLYQFLDKDLEAAKPTPTNPFPKWMTHNLVVRIRHGKIAAIGFEADNNTSHLYRWLAGSDASGLVGY